MKKAILLLMTQKGLSVLQAVIQANLSHLIAQVIIGRDSGLATDSSEDIRSLCEQAGIPHTFDRNSNLEEADYSLAISWRWMIEELQNSKLIVLHDSLLPKYRGFAPLVNALINGEPKVGVSAIFAETQYDCGDIIMQEEIEIAYPIKIGEAIGLATQAYGKIAVALFQKIEQGEEILGIAQNGKDASYSLWRDSQDYFIDWQQDSHRIKRMIDAVGYPYLGAKTLLNGQEISVKDANIVPDVAIENRTPGKVIFLEEGFPTIVCGKGLLKITEARDSRSNSILPLKKFRSRFG